ncbi:adenylate/guanylate cyclase domain-containing protein [Rhodococcus hoagii]|nr:adenylate/guanylate cyclase domain-containing protein [Prescottella equi]NKR48126.1 adenylate/guanylate cyclase domain-containing protein [Prescottella equi]NKR65467.1 adenylate/guanylate cyclase domain-containing protein [Prescottella equi]NKR78228.1 adenylate/guanylate cyclase domain-containing protein [Prescottella equi]NKT00059.1 adenylate/guanylate cyclase domain-containing protein [Prescottella equi]
MAKWVRDADRQPQLVDAVRRIRRSLPGDPSFGDPLSTAGPGGARAAARMLDTGAGASREVSMAALQVLQAVLEKTWGSPANGEVTIVFTDLVGFSSWSLQVGDGATLSLLREVAATIEPPMIERGGQVIKRLGDGLMVVFDHPDRAVEAVFAARAALATLDHAGYRPRMRVGLHTGAPQPIGADWFGVDVNVAARMMELGGNGNVVVSGNTHDAIGEERLAELGLVARRYRRGLLAAPQRGVPEDLRVYVLRPAPAPR